MNNFMTHMRHLYKFLFFIDAGKVIQKGRLKALEIDDFDELPQYLKPKNIPDAFLHLSLTDKWAFIRDVIRAQGARIKVMAMLIALISLFQLTSPVLIHQLVTIVQQAVQGQVSFERGILIAVLLSSVNIFEGILAQHYFFQCLLSAQIGTNGINFRIYEKSLKLTRASRQKRPTGDVVNLLGSDTNSVAEFGWMIVELINALLLIIAVMIMLYILLGPSSLVSVAILGILMPFVKKIGGKFVKYDERLKDARDERISLTSQIITGIRIVKFFAWENMFARDIAERRNEEIRSLRKFVKVESISISFYMLASTLVAVSTFTTYVYFGNKLDAATVFSAMSLFFLLEQPFGSLTHHISHLASGKVSAQRILEFLNEEELTVLTKPLSQKSQPISIAVEKTTIQYTDAGKPVLSDIHFQLQAGESLAIVGGVGSGKTSLLLSLFGQIPRVGGHVHFGNVSKDEAPRIAWVPQEAFIRNSTIKENILFGEDEADFTQAIKVTMLEHDLSKLSAGELTEIGEQGINLSGGQKQRVSLARAVMVKPGLVLLDDPLSAVDVATEQLLVNNLIFGEWQNITRIMATHRLEHLHRFDKILFVEDGVQLALGKFEQLIQENARFAAFFKEHLKAHGEDHPESEAKKKDSVIELVKKADHDGQLIDDEDREKGAVGLGVYFSFLKAMGGGQGAKQYLIVVMLLLLSLGVTLTPLLQNAWLSVWTNTQKNSSLLLDFLASFKSTDQQNLIVYTVLAASVVLVFVLQHVSWAFSSVRAAKNLHDECLNAVLKTHVRFFDTTPVGRILNRFSSDISAIEGQLAWSFNHAVRAFFAVLGSLGLILMLMPMVIVGLIPILAIYYHLQNIYRLSSREAQRLHSITRSPRFAHFKETLEGLNVINCMKKENLFTEKFYETLDRNQKSFYALICMNRWFTIRISLIGGTITTGVAMLLMFLAKSGKIDGGTAGLILLYSLGLWQKLNWLIRSFSMAESNMTSVERVKTYASLKPEKSVLIPQVWSDGEIWPKLGQIEFEQVVVSYDKKLPPVLKGVSFSIEDGEKVGIIGRTGAGKSTIFQTLFRFIQLQSGEIRVDGKNIAGVPLDVLRRSMAIIPQDPTLFLGVLRNNLDRFSQYSDEDIWLVLRRVQLDNFVRSLPGGLNYQVKEGGLNFSQGQRQLLCLARALLIKSKIIVLDEATANVDVETDALIQETIRKECKDQTLLIIAHRLGTVSDCDKIIELVDGKIQSIRLKE